MNNSKLTIDNILIDAEPVDTTPWMRQRETELVRIIEAVARLEQTEEWSTLKNLVFDGVTESLERRLQTEAKKSELNNPEIYKLQGQIAWAHTYSDLSKMTNRFKLELQNLRQQLNDK